MEMDKSSLTSLKNFLTLTRKGKRRRRRGERRKSSRIRLNSRLMARRIFLKNGCFMVVLNQVRLTRQR
jgi:hypothetical protein